MGVKTKISLNEINVLLKDTNIIFTKIQSTTYGITDTTHILSNTNNKYIFKLYEKSTLKDIEEQIKILKVLKNLKVAKVLTSSIKEYLNKPAVLFSFIKGYIPVLINIKQIEEIAKFLSSLHNINTYKPKNKNIYDKSNLDKMLQKVSHNNEFNSRYELVKDIELKACSLIHGDLFPDNVKFKNNTLVGVYDFTNSCYGSSYFDIAVCVVSWCFNKKYELNFIFLDKFLSIYNKHSNQPIVKKDFKIYLLYACFYYALQRFLSQNIDCNYYKEYLRKFDAILKDF